MYYGSGSVAHTARQSHHMRRARGYAQIDVMAAILKVWHIYDKKISSHIIVSDFCGILVV